MKKIFCALLLSFSLSALASGTAPQTYTKLTGSNVWIDKVAMKYSHPGQFPTRIEIWTWDETNGYIFLIVGCQYHHYRELHQGKEVGRGYYDPGHYYWQVRELFCL